ncbi:MAG: thioredoxin family protein, partial [Steroidobacteraceae bacterium]
STLDNLANDESLPRVDRVGMAYARVLLARVDTPKGPLPADVQAIARERAAWGDRETKDPYERQAVINRAAAALDEAGLSMEANDLLTRELKVSKSPYYFMLDIADLAQQAGHKDQALHWLERAYNESQGPATRFQWGTDYLIGLLEMAPEDDNRIQRVGLAVIDELGRDRNSIHQRTRIRLERIDQEMRAWNKGDNHRPVVRAMRARLQEICAPIAADDSARKTCDAFLNPA